MNKQALIDAAEVFDAWRVLPHALMIGFCVWTAYITVRLLSWYQALPAAERGIESAGLTAALITAISGFGALIFKLYVQSGRLWPNSPPRAAD